MTRSVFMLISAIYGLLLGGFLVFAPTEAMKNYGYTSLDVLHNDLSIHLGLMVIILDIFLLLKRNSENQELVNTILWMTLLVTLSGALYDIYALKHVAEMPTIGYVDIGIRLVLGLATWFYIKK